MLEPTDFSEFYTEYPNYFPGQYLLADDFKLQHDYLSDRLRYHNRSLHASGIIEGLEVTVQEDKKSVVITRGSAIDNEGNLIVLKDNQTIDGFDSSELEEGYLWIQYQKTEDAYQQETDDSHTRWKEEPLVDYTTPDAAPDDCVKLAKLTISNDTGDTISDNDPSIREYSGVYLPSSDGTALTLRYQGNADNGAVFTGSLKIEENLEISGDLTLQNEVAVNNISNDIAVDNNNDDQTIATVTAIKSYVDSKVEEEEWTTLELINSWTNQDDNKPARYFKDSSGIVHLEGVLEFTDYITSSIAFTLPDGYRPSTDCYYPAYSCYGHLIYIAIFTNGNVQHICYTGVWKKAVMYLDGITFGAA